MDYLPVGYAFLLDKHKQQFMRRNTRTVCNQELLSKGIFWNYFNECAHKYHKYTCVPTAPQLTVMCTQY